MTARDGAGHAAAPRVVATRVVAPRVVATLVGDRPGTFVTTARPAITLDLGGVVGDRHYGVARPADARSPRRTDGTAHPRGTPVRNHRQVSLVAVEELDRLAARLGLPPVAPAQLAAWLGTSVLLAGAPDLTAWPPHTRLSVPSGAVLVVSGPTLPCVGPGRVLQAAFPEVPELATAFPRTAVGVRGVVAWVECGGAVGAGDPVSRA